MKKINYKKLFYIVLDLFFVALLAILSTSTIRAFEQSNIVDHITIMMIRHLLMENSFLLHLKILKKHNQIVKKYVAKLNKKERFY